MRSWTVFITFLLCAIYGISRGQSAAIVVLPLKNATPIHGTLLGHIKSGNNSTAVSCDYQSVVDDAKLKAHKLGGNLVKITQLVKPVFISGCYAISADVYQVPDITPYAALIQKTAVAENAGVGFTTLYIYRLKDTLFPSASYNVYMNDDSLIFHSKSKAAAEIKLKNTDNIKISAKGNAGAVTINTNEQKIIYIRCGVKHGSGIKQLPVIEVVDNKRGEQEFNMPTQKNRESDPAYLNAVH